MTRPCNQNPSLFKAVFVRVSVLLGPIKPRKQRLLRHTNTALKESVFLSLAIHISSPTLQIKSAQHVCMYPFHHFISLSRSGSHPLLLSRKQQNHPDFLSLKLISSSSQIPHFPFQIFSLVGDCSVLI